MKVKIECSKEELDLIQRALELYTRVGLYQFDKLTLCHSLQKQVWDNIGTEIFDSKIIELKEVFGYSANSGPGIFNKEKVGDDVRIACDLFDTIRHEKSKQRVPIEEAELIEKSHTSICKIAGMKFPYFKIEIE